VHQDLKLENILLGDDDKVRCNVYPDTVGALAVPRARVFVDGCLALRHCVSTMCVPHR
jgi:hypothetical protein